MFVSSRLRGNEVGGSILRGVSDELLDRVHSSVRALCIVVAVVDVDIVGSCSLR